MRQTNNERVVLMAHSMGNRNAQYFLRWITDQPQFGQEWVDTNIHAFFALGPPFLGATKTVRAVVSGDCMGLEVFLTPEEGRQMARGSASLPSLFPLQEDLFPDTVAHLRTNGDSCDTEQKRRKSVVGTKKVSNTDIASETYQEMGVDEIVSIASPVGLRLSKKTPEAHSFTSFPKSSLPTSTKTTTCTWTRLGEILLPVAFRLCCAPLL